MIELITRNVVLLARQFNPAILTDIWLVNEGIVTEEEFNQRTERLVTPVFSKIETAAFDLLAIDERLQLTLRAADLPAAIVRDKVGRIAEVLHHTPYTAVGFNFIYKMSREGGIRQFLREQFMVAGSAFARRVDGPDAYYGCTMLKPAHGGFQKVTIMPRPEEENAVVDINYHLTLAGTPQEIGVQIAGRIDQWQQLNDESEATARAIDEG